VPHPLMPHPAADLDALAVLAATRDVHLDQMPGPTPAASPSRTSPARPRIDDTHHHDAAARHGTALRGWGDRDRPTSTATPAAVPPGIHGLNKPYDQHVA
jgi:hypothetical protein